MVSRNQNLVSRVWTGSQFRSRYHTFEPGVEVEPGVDFVVEATNSVSIGPEA